MNLLNDIGLLEGPLLLKLLSVLSIGYIATKAFWKYLDHRVRLTLNPSWLTLTSTRPTLSLDLSMDASFHPNYLNDGLLVLTE